MEGSRPLPALSLWERSPVAPGQLWEYDPPRTRTENLLIKSQLLCQIELAGRGRRRWRRCRVRRSRLILFGLRGPGQLGRRPIQDLFIVPKIAYRHCYENGQCRRIGPWAGFKPAPTPVPWDATAFFIDLMWPGKAMVFPAQSLPRTQIRGGNPGGAWRMFYLGRPTLKRPCGGFRRVDALFRAVVI